MQLLSPEQIERQRREADMLAGRVPNPQQSPVVPAGMSAGTVDPYADLRSRSQDFTGQENKIESQRKLAQSMRGQKPEGRTAGPYNVYYGPSIGESLAGAGGNMLGAYLDKRADKADVKLDEQRSESKLSKAIEEQDRYQAGEDRLNRKESREEAAVVVDADRYAKDSKFKERVQKERERAAKVGEKKDLSQMAIDALDLEPIQYLRKDGSKLFVGYRLNEGDTAVEPYNLDTGKKVNMGELSFDPSAIGDGKSFNEPIRFVDAKTGDERMLSWNKGGFYLDANSREQLTPNEVTGWTPEAAMSEAQREKAVGDWVAKNGNTLELIHDIQAANVAYGKANPDGAESPEGVFNWFTKQSGAAGDMFRLIDDIGEDGAPTQNAYAAGQTVFNAISRIRAGLSQTVSEVERIEKEIGMPLVISPEVLVQYWDRLGEKVLADLSRAEETMSPRTMQALGRWRSQKSNQELTSGFGAEKSGRGQGDPGSGKTIEDYSYADYNALSPEDQATLDGGGSI